MIINMGLNMFLTPYITKNIGVEAFGYINLANTVVGYVEIIAVALNSLAARYIAIDYHEGNKEKAYVDYNTVLVSNMFLGVCILLIFGVAVLKLEDLINIPEPLVTDVKLLFLLTAINYCVMITGTVFNVAAFIHNRMDIAAIVKDCSYVVKVLVIVLLFAAFQPKVWYVSLAVITSTLFIVSANSIYTYKSTPDVKIDPHKFSKKRVGEILRNGIWNSISSLGVLLNSGIDLLVTNKLLSPLAMGQLSICKSLTTVFNTFVSVFTQAFRPIQLEAYAHKDTKRMIQYFNISIKVTGFICTLLFAGFFAVGYDFLRLWVPTQDAGLLYKIMMIILIGDVMGAITYPILYVFTIVKKLKVISLINIGCGICNVLLELLLLSYTDMGLYAIVITTAVLNIIVQMGITPILASKDLKLRLTSFYPAIGKSLVNGVLLCFCFVLLNRAFLFPLKWLNLILKITVLSIVGLFISLMVLFTKEERTELISMIVRKLRREKE